jgi:poly(3-hydroxyalkanoate) synthetase
LAAASASESAAGFLNDLAHLFAEPRAERPRVSEPDWTTRNRVTLELESMRLRDFSTGRHGVPTLVCAPFALHGATIADFAPGHSVVEALCAGRLPRVYVTDWRSATNEMRFLSIDSYLRDLNVVIDDLRPPVDLIGLCQGGWLALVYAARFPDKVHRLVLAGSPVDLHGGQSELSRQAAEAPLAVFEDLVRRGGGRMLGDRMLELWAPKFDTEEIHRVLQISPNMAPARLARLEQRFRDWYASTVDLPGTYYLQVVSWLFKENRIADGRFLALGRTVDPATVRIPVFLLAARDDETVSTGQLFATARLVDTPKHSIEMATEPGGHLSLFLGANTLRHAWPRIARWLHRDLAMSQAS